MKRARPRHTFHFKTRVGDKDVPMTEPVKVRLATKPVRLELRAEDVRRSMALNGVGSTQTCTMALCLKRHKEAFPHDVGELVAWQYSRVFVQSKTNKHNKPSECVKYRHNSKIAKLNDSKNGQAELLSLLEKNGPMTVTLHPIKARAKQSAIPARKGRKTGERSKLMGAKNAKGAKLRYATAFAQYVPDAA